MWSLSRGGGLVRLRPRLKWVTLAMPFFLFAAAVSGATGEVRTFSPVTFEDRRWQILSDDVLRAYVGPDDRVWLVRGRHWRERRSTQDFQRLVETQFGEEQPQIQWGMPVLFEKGGRVWFRAFESMSTILGYDGTEWIERTADSDHFFLGQCSRNGRHAGAQCNLEVGDSLLFPDTHGVHVYNGRQWTYRRFAPAGRANRPSRLRLRAQPGGTGVIVGVQVDADSVLWCWRGGQWRRVEIGRVALREVAPIGADEALVLCDDWRILHVSLQASEGDAAAKKLIAEFLRTDAVAVRQELAARIAACGLPAKVQVEKAMSGTADPSVLRRLMALRKSLDMPAPGFRCRAPGSNTET